MNRNVGLKTMGNGQEKSISIATGATFGSLSSSGPRLSSGPKVRDKVFEVREEAFLNGPTKANKIHTRSPTKRGIPRVHKGFRSHWGCGSCKLGLESHSLMK